MVSANWKLKSNKKFFFVNKIFELNYILHQKSNWIWILRVYHMIGVYSFVSIFLMSRKTTQLLVLFIQWNYTQFLWIYETFIAGHDLILLGIFLQDCEISYQSMSTFGILVEWWNNWNWLIMLFSRTFLLYFWLIMDVFLIEQGYFWISWVWLIEGRVEFEFLFCFENCNSYEITHLIEQQNCSDYVWKCSECPESFSNR